MITINGIRGISDKHVHNSLVFYLMCAKIGLYVLYLLPSKFEACTLTTTCANCAKRKGRIKRTMQRKYDEL